MHKGRVNLVGVLALGALALTLTGCSRGTIVRVNGEKINKDEFTNRLEYVPIQTQQGAVPAGRYIMEQMIKEKLIQQLAKEEGVAPTDGQIDKKLAYFKKSGGGDFERMLATQGITQEQWKTQQKLQQALINVVSKDVDVPDSDVRKAYDQLLKMNPSPVKRPEQVLISVIICKTKAKADKAYSMLNSGQEFTTVALAMSDDPNAKQTQGRLDYISKDDKRVPKPIADAAFTLQANQYSKPFYYDKGTQWIILKANQRRPARVQSYEDVKDILLEQMKMQKGSTNGKFAERMQEFIKNADIKINVDRYKKIPETMKKQAAKALEEDAKKLPKIGGQPAGKPAAQPGQ